MKSIVIVEQDNGLVNRPSLAAISAAKKLSSNIDLLVLDPSEINTIKNIAFVDYIYSFKEKQKDVSAESMVNFLKDFIENTIMLLRLLEHFLKTLFQDWEQY